MDVKRFACELPSLFGGDMDADHPTDRRFRPLMDDVAGLASENKLALLNHAATVLPEDEAYVEVGSYQGLSIIAAALENDGKRFYAIESFSGYAIDKARTKAALQSNLARWDAASSVHLLEAEAFRALAQPGLFDRPVGVYFYDANHSGIGHYLALGLAEPHLADEALVILDDTSSRVVAKATDRYVSTHPGYELLLEFDGAGRHPRWWNGIRVYRFRRGIASARNAVSRSFDLVWRRAFYLSVYDPLARAAGSTMPETWRAIADTGKRVAASLGRGSGRPII